MNSIFSTKIPSNEPSPIPHYLIAEELDGIPFYYKGYKQVLSGEKTLEEIKGSSVLQFAIIQYIIRCLALFDPDEEQFMIATNEAGLHMGHRKNVGNDLALYDVRKMTADKIIGKYASIPPEVVIEIDIDVESIEMSPMDGAFLKTKRMLEFGVKKVIWIFTASQKVLIALPNQNWQTVDWDKDIEITAGLSVNVAQYLKKKGVITGNGSISEK
jgi:hypothetical protein